MQRTPRPPIARLGERFCKLNCGSAIHFVRSLKFDVDADRYVAGDYVPVDVELLSGNGERTLVAIYPVAIRGRVVVNASPDVQGYEPHFGTCPVYLERRRREEARPVQLALFDNESSADVFSRSN